MNQGEQLTVRPDRLRTTPMGAERIRKNLNLDTEDVIGYCRALIMREDCRVDRRGKNLYCESGGVRLTVHGHSCTVITAHRIRAI